MNRKLISVGVLMLLLVGAVSGAAATNTQWTSTAGNSSSLTVLKGAGSTTTPAKESYNITVNTTGVGTSNTAADIVLESRTNVSAISGSSITTSGSAAVSQTTSGWTYSSAHGVWYQEYQVTTAGSSVTFHVANASEFAPLASSTNTTLTTKALQPSRHLAVGNVSANSVSIKNLSKYPDAVSYQVVKQLMQPSASVSSPIQNATTLNGTNVTIAAGTPTLTAQVNSTVNRDVGNGNATMTVVVNKSLATEANVHWSNLQNAAFDYTSSSYNGSSQLAAYHFTVQNASKSAGVQLHMNVSQDPVGSTVTNGLQVSTGYTAHVVGTPGSSTPAYAFSFTGGLAAASGHPVTASALQLPVPGFLAGLGSTAQLVMWALVAVSAALTLYALYLLTQVRLSALSKWTGYLGVLGLQIGAITHQLMAWLLPVYTIIIIVVVLVLWQIKSKQSGSPADISGGWHQVGP